VTAAEYKDNNKQPKKENMKTTTIKCTGGLFSFKLHTHQFWMTICDDVFLDKADMDEKIAAKCEEGWDDDRGGHSGPTTRITVRKASFEIVLPDGQKIEVEQDEEAESLVDRLTFDYEMSDQQAEEVAKDIRNGIDTEIDRLEVV
jgi:hypothetical protein